MAFNNTPAAGEGRNSGTSALDSALGARLGPTAALGISVKPVGGPTTGPVIAKGGIGDAANAGNVVISKVGRADRISV